jgi:DMSO/TMAO reductase YedYZ molybdopterin-dependent catalytic subunit
MKDQALQLQTVTKNPFNAETPFPALNRDRTASELFYVRNHFDVPSIDASEFKLNINGDIENPGEYSIDRVKNFGEKKLLVVMECAGNGRTSMVPAIQGTQWDLGAVSQAEFTGTSLRNLLGETVPTDDAVEVKFTGADQGQIHTEEVNSYARSLPLVVAMHPDTMLVWEMNGQPLSKQHGYPLRLVVPGWYGMASVKWLQEISILSEPFKGFFQSQEYVYLGENGIPDHMPVTNMRVRSLILTPENEFEIEDGPIQISGIAWSGDGKVTKVELSFNEGQNWFKANLNPADSDYGMARWEYVWNPNQLGEYTIIARAFDSHGKKQPLNSRWNKGGYGNNVTHRIILTIT